MCREYYNYDVVGNEILPLPQQIVLGAFVVHDVGNNIAHLKDGSMRLELSEPFEKLGFMDNRKLGY